jgi:hypothetical protein
MTKHEINISLNEDDSGRGDGSPVPANPDIEDVVLEGPKSSIKRGSVESLRRGNVSTKDVRMVGWMSGYDR